MFPSRRTIVEAFQRDPPRATNVVDRLRNAKAAARTKPIVGMLLLTRKSRAFPLLRLLQANLISRRPSQAFHPALLHRRATRKPRHSAALTTYLSGSNSGRTPESPHGISETERLLAELTVLRGRNMPLDESQLPVSPMVERGPTASKGRSVSIDMLPSISLISPRSALRTPEPRVTSASQDAPTARMPRSLTFPTTGDQQCELGI
ncbi:uncharacterized protein [Dermacentor albipictus]|uniref:uncharacterized protein n=1 Tax=Dermacentor albipictus TaxID=60249 RepID=UPI0038FCF366